METEARRTQKLGIKDTKRQLHDRLLEIARRQGVMPIDDISVLQSPEPIDDDQFEQEIAKQRERHRMKDRSAP